MSLVVFFFLQAKDGIRYVAVTGVQTCPFPISPRLRREHPTLGDPTAATAERCPGDAPLRVGSALPAAAGLASRVSHRGDLSQYAPRAARALGRAGSLHEIGRAHV